ncbi:MAG TPA: GDSL-type esterase/lipase family protein [Terracidiphilus sp.]|nr:GDSL-type esterase/lipase family protein [Terracidiphilus sp.]
METSEIYERLPLRAPPPKLRPMKPRPVFPLKTAQAMVVVAVVLGVCRGIDRGKGLAPDAVAEAFRLRWPAAPAPPVPHALTVAVVNPRLPASSPLLVDDSRELDPFFTELWRLEQDKDAGVVTVLHYGDSPTTADLITGDVRTQLQDRFGDAGRGYTLIAKPWAWYGHRGVEMSDHGWKIRTGVGLVREGIYGLGGAAFEGQPDAWSEFRLTGSEQSSAVVEYLATPGGGSFAVEADGQTLVERATRSDAQAAGFVDVTLPAGTKKVTIRPTQGTVTLFGVDFRRGSSGVLYDSLGLNGVTTSVLARVLQPEIWKEELARAKPALVIVNYGSNESSYADFVHRQYADELRLAIQRIRVAAPGAAILIMSPMDRGERNGLDGIETMNTIPDIVAIQRQVADETHCAFFDTYDAMGSKGTMARWYAASPRLVTADLLHPTPQGAAIVGGLFVEQLELRYDRWKIQHGIAVPSTPAPAAMGSTELKATLEPQMNRAKQGNGVRQ